ncbi:MULTISPECIES: hypothetical protein [unclassified Novosphingobium]|uniref:hypothetical protein n=1 Tax=unclassified Novosphingobium TaxID=2644732 RepID=UPI000D31F9E2|nr:MULTISPECIES: hypothetical protein [unclassified Novosphingobium]PTR06417.1 hypothetical protein C8K11_12030 [Novosphingobium sp. GV055]PUA94836.1 hypothetical protein C8K12_12030 [Novosphingobium sp. GV061]PUB13761.1 hypothetical protein C8K14_12030 [Novosphingobium sp. GV079]PUB38459.1 hypothetical protein C8K10_12030 [Novosphingobium sp. GV027]
MSHGSQQLRTFRRARRDGASINDAAALAGISIGEARLHAAEDDRNPPPPEAYEPLLATPRSTTEEEATMARQKKTEVKSEQQESGGVYNRPNAAEAIRIYRAEIAPRKAFISEKQGDLSDPYSRIKDDCNFPRKILDLLFHLEAMEDAKRDHFLTALHLGLTEMNFSRPLDLVTMAEGAEPGQPVVPAGAKGRSKMATIPSDGIDADLATAAGAEPRTLSLQ